MEHLHKIKDMLVRELEEFARKESIESYDLDMIHKLTDTIKNIDKIDMLEDGGHSGMRERGMPRTYEYDDDYSMRRRRDSRGRYSRDDGRDHMVNELEDMMGRADTREDRERIQRMIDRLRSE